MDSCNPPLEKLGVSINFVGNDYYVERYCFEALVDKFFFVIQYSLVIFVSEESFCYLIQMDRISLSWNLFW